MKRVEVTWIKDQVVDEHFTIPKGKVFQASIATEEGEVVSGIKVKTRDNGLVFTFDIQDLEKEGYVSLRDIPTDI